MKKKYGMMSGKGGSRNYNDYCLTVARGYDLPGPADDSITGPTAAGINGDCATQLLAAVNTCGSATREAYISCLVGDGGDRGILFPEAGWLINNPADTTHEFDSVQTNDGDGSLKTTVGVAGSSKVRLEYLDPVLQDSNVGDLTRISFDYFIEACPTGTTLPCHGQIYVNIYTTLELRLLVWPFAIATILSPLPRWVRRAQPVCGTRYRSIPTNLPTPSSIRDNLVPTESHHLVVVLLPFKRRQI